MTIAALKDQAFMLLLVLRLTLQLTHPDFFFHFSLNIYKFLKRLSLQFARIEKELMEKLYRKFLHILLHPSTLSITEAY